MPNTRDQHDQAIISGADYFTATIFLGRARYATVEHLPTVMAAREAATGLMQQHQNGRDAMVYAVKDGMTAHVENVARH